LKPDARRAVDDAPIARSAHPVRSARNLTKRLSIRKRSPPNNPDQNEYDHDLARRPAARISDGTCQAAAAGSDRPMPSPAGGRSAAHTFAGCLQNFPFFLAPPTVCDCKDLPLQCLGPALGSWLSAFGLSRPPWPIQKALREFRALTFPRGTRKVRILKAARMARRRAGTLQT